MKNPLTRRDFLNRCGIGFGALGLAGILGQNVVAGGSGGTGRSPGESRLVRMSVASASAIAR